MMTTSEQLPQNVSYDNQVGLQFIFRLKKCHIYAKEIQKLIASNVLNGDHTIGSENVILLFIIKLR